jgi:hypothetical protein
MVVAIYIEFKFYFYYFFNIYIYIYIELNCGLIFWIDLYGLVYKLKGKEKSVKVGGIG